MKVLLQNSNHSTWHKALLHFANKKGRGKKESSDDKMTRQRVCYVRYTPYIWQQPPLNILHSKKLSHVAFWDKLCWKVEEKFASKLEIIVYCTIIVYNRPDEGSLLLHGGFLPNYSDGTEVARARSKLEDTNFGRAIQFAISNFKTIRNFP